MKSHFPQAVAKLTARRSRGAAARPSQGPNPSTGHATACHAWASFHSGPSASRRCAPVSSNVRPLMWKHAVDLGIPPRHRALSPPGLSATCVSSAPSPGVLRAGCPSFGGQRKAVAARHSTKAMVYGRASGRRGSGQRSRCSPAEVAPHATAYRPPPQARRDGTARQACTGAGIGSSSWRHS